MSSISSTCCRKRCMTVYQLSLYFRSKMSNGTFKQSTNVYEEHGRKTKESEYLDVGKCTQNHSLCDKKIQPTTKYMSLMFQSTPSFQPYFRCGYNIVLVHAYARKMKQYYTRDRERYTRRGPQNEVGKIVTGSAIYRADALPEAQPHTSIVCPDGCSAPDMHMTIRAHRNSCYYHRFESISNFSQGYQA